MNKKISGKLTPASSTARRGLSLEAKQQLQRSAIGAIRAQIDQLDYEEKIRLFQQLEVIEGIRVGAVTAEGLSKAGVTIIKNRESLHGRQKTIYTKRVKRLLFASVNGASAKTKG